MRRDLLGWLAFLAIALLTPLDTAAVIELTPSPTADRTVSTPSETAELMREIMKSL